MVDAHTGSLVVSPYLTIRTEVQAADAIRHIRRELEELAHDHPQVFDPAWLPTIPQSLWRPSVQERQHRSTRRRHSEEDVTRTLMRLGLARQLMETARKHTPGPASAPQED